MLKRLLGYVYQIHKTESFSCPLPYMNLYAVGGWPEGVRYIMAICQPATFLSGPGYTRDAVLETLAVSFYLAPTWGTVIAADTIRDAWSVPRAGPRAPSPFPDGWAIAPEELKAGLDYSTPEMTKADLAALTDWYMRVCGEVPKTIQLYANIGPTS